MRKKILFYILVALFFQQAIHSMNIFDAIEKEDFITIKTLLRKNTDVNVHTPQKETYLSRLLDAYNCTVSRNLACDEPNCRKRDCQNKYRGVPLCRKYFIKKAKLFKITHMLLDKCSKTTINFANSSGDTPLHLACYYGNTKAVQLLLRHKASTKAYNRTQDTPLHYACESGNLAIVQSLFEHNKNQIHYRNKSGDTPLHLACFNNKTKIALFLLKHNAHVNVHNDTQDSPLNFACENNNITLAKKLLKKSSPNTLHLANDAGRTPLHSACYNGKPKIVQLLIEHGAKKDINTPDAGGSTPLHLACCSNSLATVKILLEHGVTTSINQPNEDNITPLYSTLHNTNKEMAFALLRTNRVSTKSIYRFDNTTPTDKQCIGELYFNKTPFSFAFQHKFPKLAKLFLKTRPNQRAINTPDTSFGRTALHWACLYGQGELVKLLLEHCTPKTFNLFEITKETPLSFACASNDTAIINALLPHSWGETISPPNIQTDDTFAHLPRPLLIAAQNNNFALVKKMILLCVSKKTPIIEMPELIYITCHKRQQKITKFLGTLATPQDLCKAISILCKDNNEDDNIENTKFLLACISKEQITSIFGLACKNNLHPLAQFLIPQLFAQGAQLQKTPQYTCCSQDIRDYLKEKAGN